MKTHLRLAERQGLLSGYQVSAPQFMALIILNHLDEIEKAHEDQEALKRSMVASNNYKNEILFPHYFKKDEDVTVIEVTGEDEIPENAIVDYSAVEWKSPSDDMAEYERIMAALAESSTGSFSGDAVGEISWSEWM